MKGFVKFLKNLLWLCLVLVLLAGIGGICFGFYDYYSGNKEPYDRLLTQAQLMLVNLKNKITGEETVELTIEEVSPYKLPVMTLSLEGTSRDDVDGNKSNVIYDEEGRRVIFVYGKDLGGDLYFPYGAYAGEHLGGAWLFAGNEENMPEITEFVSWDVNCGVGMVSEEFLMGLEPGEYYIFLEPRNEAGEVCGGHCVPLIVEDTTTYTSTQQGFACEPDKGLIMNDLQDIKPLLLPLYNLGEGRILTVQEVRNSATGGQDAFTMDASDYTITPDGKAFILSEEYLSGLNVNSMVTFKVLVSSGKTFDMGFDKILTLDGEPEWLTISGPDWYDLSEGGDFVLQLDRGWAQYYTCIAIRTAETDVLVYDENFGRYGTDMPSMDEDNDVVILSEELMKTLVPNLGYHVMIGYSTGGMDDIFVGHYVEVVS